MGDFSIMKNSWGTDKHGRMSGFSYHDKTIVGISADEDNSLKITIRDLNDGKNVESITIKLLNVKEYNISNIRNGTIVMTLFVWRIDEVPDGHLTRRDGGWRILFRGLIESPAIDGAVAEIIRKYPGDHLFVLYSSYGGLVAAVCGEIVVD